MPSTYTRDNTVTKAAQTITLGPFHSLPPTAGSEVQQPFSVHYEMNGAIVGLRSLRRSVEVSHWGANLNVQDEMAAVNMGPKWVANPVHPADIRLKGQFSRLAHQQSRYHASTPSQILSEFSLRLPPNARDVYFYDQIGNVSTSRFRPGSTARRGRTLDAHLELRPRYPLLGGWNYTFTVGWDAPLGDSLNVDSKTGKYVVAVPFMTLPKDWVVDDAELRIVLPEGSRDVEVMTPFAVDEMAHSTIWTYLDSAGRHAVTLKKKGCTENHAQMVYVSRQDNGFELTNRSRTRTPFPHIYENRSRWQLSSGDCSSWQWA